MKNNLSSMFFNENGSFKKPLDPYRYNDENKDIYDLLFDENGDADYEVVKDAEIFAKKYNCPFDSDVVKYIYSSDISSITRGNYSSIYMWR